MSLSSRERERYQRHLSLAEIGAAGQERLKAARVLVVGAGGLGSPAALYLAAAGCGTLGLLDYDSVELSNLQRQVLFDTDALSRSKAEAGGERLARLNPDIRIVAHALELKAANVRELFAQYDLVLDGTDRLATRYLVNDACVLLAQAAGVGGHSPLRRAADDLRARQGPVLPLRVPALRARRWLPTAPRRACSACCPVCSARCRRPRRSSSSPGWASR